MDECSAAVLDEVVFNLTVLRSPMLVGNAGAELHALVSLAAQIGARVPEVVRDAREQLVPWSVIGRQLGLGAADARRRYEPARRQPLAH